MGLILKDRIKETSSTTGQGTLTLGGAANGFRSFADIGDGNITYYCIVDGNTFEVGVGTYTAAIAFAGDTGPPYPSGNKALAETWDGTSWTEVGDLNTAGSYVTGAGLNTSAIRMGSASGSNNQVETWDGSSWTETTEINTGRYSAAGSGSSSSSALLYGGNGSPAVTGATEFWNGSSWTEVNDLSTGRLGHSGNTIGAVSSLAAGGTTTASTPGATTATEEFSADAALSTVTVS